MHRTKGKLSGVLSKGFKADKCKTSLRMAVARIKLLRNKKEVQLRQVRREIAPLLEANQDQTARIRVEHVIREEKFIQAYELIEVYCELIVARLSIIDSQKSCPIDLKEAIASVIFASMRCSDITELEDVRKHFTSKYGKDFATAALEVRPDSGVNRLVIEKLSAVAPDVQTKIKTLRSIAEEHNIKWEPKAFEEKLQKPNEELLHGPATYSGVNVSNMRPSASSMPTQQPTYSGASAANMHSGSATSPLPTGPYSRAEIPANRTAYGTENSNAFSQENIQTSSNAPVPPTYSSAPIPGYNNIPHGNPGRPYSQYDTTVRASSSEDLNHHRERKPSMSGANWNVEFKDATSAAQAAAESAEMASIAARAAAQLASRGNYSREQSSGVYESAANSHENTSRKQPAEHLLKDQKRSFHDSSSGINDVKVISSDARKHSGGAETSRIDTQDMPTTHAPTQQFHSYKPESHSYVYGMPTEQPRSHSPEHSNFDDLYERQSSIGRSDIHQSDHAGKNLQDTRFDGRSMRNVEIGRASSDKKGTTDHYGNFSSSDGTFTHGSSTIWDNHSGKTQDNSSAAVFDEYESDVKENLFDTLSSSHTEQSHNVHDHMDFSTADWSQLNESESPSSHRTSTLFSGIDTTADWSQQNKSESPSSHRTSTLFSGIDATADWSEQNKSESPSSHRTSTLFSGIETQASDDVGVNRRDIPYDNLPPTFDSDGGSSDEDAKSLRSHSIRSASSVLSKGANRSSGKLFPDAKESTEDDEPSPRKKYGVPPGLNVSYKEQHGGHSGSPRFDYSGSQTHRSLNRVQSIDSDLSDEETVPDNRKVASSAGADESHSSPLSRETPATFDDKDSSHFGLNFGRLTPGLRNKLQPPPYTKNSRENVLPSHSLNKASASIEESVDSKENTTSFGQTRNTPKSSRSIRTFFGGNSNNDLYDKDPSARTPREARSTMTRNSFDLDDTRKPSDQFDNTIPITANSSERVDLSQEQKRVGARQEMRSRMSKNFFDSDDSEEEPRQAPLSKRPGEQIPSRRTREATSDTKRGGRVQTEAQYADESESMPKETKVNQAFNNSGTERRRNAPGYSRFPVQPSSSKTEHAESPTIRGKSREAEVDNSSVPENEKSAEPSVETPKESTPKTTPAHVHPKLPTDYDSFAAHFKSLRANHR